MEKKKEYNIVPKEDYNPCFNVEFVKEIEMEELKLFFAQRGYEGVRILQCEEPSIFAQEKRTSNNIWAIQFSSHITTEEVTSIFGEQLKDIVYQRYLKI